MPSKMGVKKDIFTAEQIIVNVYWLHEITRIVKIRKNMVIFNEKKKMNVWYKAYDYFTFLFCF